MQEFAWRVVETRCSYQSYERERRSFWAYDARASRVDGGIAYSIEILSEIPWRKAGPPALIQMTIVDDDGSLRLAALQSTFVVCGPSPA